MAIRSIIKISITLEIKATLLHKHMWKNILNPLMRAPFSMEDERGYARRKKRVDPNAMEGINLMEIPWKNVGTMPR